MNSDPLAELKPLIAPPPISWWPPAPGWWILAALVLLALVALLVFFYRRWRHHHNTSYQREATQLLDVVHTLPEAQQLQEVAEILRRAAVCAWGRERAGTSSWEQLIQFSRSEYSQRARKKTAIPTLDETSCHLLSNNLYNGTPPSETAMQTLIAQSKAWLKTLPPVEQ